MIRVNRSRDKAKRWSNGVLAGCVSVFAVLGLVADPQGGTEHRSPRSATAMPTAADPAGPLDEAPTWVPAESTGQAVSAAESAVDLPSVSAAESAVDLTSVNPEAAEPGATAGPSTLTAETGDEPTFLQVERWCSASTPLWTWSSWPDCPARSATTDAWHAAADAGFRGSSMFVSASARAPTATVVGTAQASATWGGRALRRSGEGGPVRVRLTGVSGSAGPTCRTCAVGLADGSLTISVNMSYVDDNGDMVRGWSSCYFRSGETVPALVTVPDDCMPGDTFVVPPRTAIWVELWLDAYASTGVGAKASAILDVRSATIDSP